MTGRGRHINFERGFVLQTCSLRGTSVTSPEGRERGPSQRLCVLRARIVELNLRDLLGHRAARPEGDDDCAPS